MPQRIRVVCVVFAGVAGLMWGLLLHSGNSHTSDTLVRKSHLLEFSTTMADGGRCMDGGVEAQEFSFSFRNPTQDTVFVESVASDCACTVAEYDARLLPGMVSEIKIIVTPTVHKKDYSVTVRARQGELLHEEVLTVNFEVVELSSVVLDPPTILLGELTVGRPFSVERELRITDAQGNPVFPSSIASPTWLQIEPATRDACVLLRFTGEAPKTPQGGWGKISLALPSPHNEQSIHFSYSIRPQYSVEPRRVFGSIHRDQRSERSLMVKGLNGHESVEYSVEMQGNGSIAIVPGSQSGQFLVSPHFQGGDEVSGTVSWTIYSEAKSLLGTCQSEFVFLRRI